VRGVLTVSQVSSGRKNRLFYEISGSKSSLAWDSERPNELWIGHRTAPNQTLLKDPSLLSPEARETASYPGGHNEGFPDTFKQLYTKVYNYIFAGDYTKHPTSRPSPMATTRCSFAKPSSAARKKASGLRFRLRSPKSGDFGKTSTTGVVEVRKTRRYL
jgi:hypothetical protein